MANSAYCSSWGFFAYRSIYISLVNPEGGGIHAWGQADAMCVFDIACVGIANWRSERYLSMNKWVAKGLWCSSSCINFLRADQMAQRVTVMLKIHALASGSAIKIRCSTNSGSHKAHTHLAMVQRISECAHESSSPHTTHHDVVDMFLWLSTSTVGIEHWAKRHKKTLIFQGMFTFQSLDQLPCSHVFSEDPTRPSSQASRRNLVMISRAHRKHPPSSHGPKPRSQDTV